MTAGAQAAPHLQTSASTSINPGATQCSNSLTVQIFASIASACASANGNGSASASGQMNTSNGQMTGSAAASWTGGTAVTASGNASYVDSLTITGDLTRIYRAFMTANMNATASPGSGFGSAFIFLFADVMAPDGAFIGGTSWTTQTDFNILNQSAAPSLNVFSAVLAQSSSALVRFGIAGSAQVTADESNPSVWANVAFNAPKFAIVDQAGNDITNEYSLTFASGRGVVATPEPASLLLVGTGLGAVALRFRRRKAGKAA